MKKLLLLLPASLLLSGCLGELLSMSCGALEDSDHCYQAAAVQEGDAEDCKKVTGAGFTGSNPPQDKCFLQIAQNTGDPSVCDSIEGGFMSYSKEECLANVWKNHSVDECKDAKDEMSCRAAYAQNGKGCGEGYVLNKEKNTCETPPKVTAEDFEDKVGEDIKSLGQAAGGKYMEMLEKAIEDETDPNKLAGLQKYKEFLDQAGEKMDQAATTIDTLKELKKIFLDAYDPSMNVENMRVDSILSKGLMDRLKDKLFGGKEPTGTAKEEADADDALTVYEKMLERQGEIDFLKKDLKGRLGETIVSKAKDEATGKLKETAEGIAEGIAGTAFSAVGIVDQALSAFQEEAKKTMFIDLAKAYNRRRDDLAAKHPEMDGAQLHTLTVQQVKDDPYQDNANTGFVKFGNLLENKDCQDEGNPLCIDNRVWWTAMDKTYRHSRK